MVAQKLVGSGASARKYDLLTALAVSGLAGSPVHMRSMMRLMTMVTARYNWRLDEVTIGQADLARMWSVKTRTVKREIKRLREMGLLVIKRPGARGRVTTYALDHEKIDILTRSVWQFIGPDFAERMETDAEPDQTVIAFPTMVAETAVTDGLWSRAVTRLSGSDTARFHAWYAPLREDTREGGVLLLRAPSGFHAHYVATHLIGDLTSAVQAIDPTVTRVIVIN